MNFGMDYKDVVLSKNGGRNVVNGLGLLMAAVGLIALFFVRTKRYGSAEDLSSIGRSEQNHVEPNLEDEPVLGGLRPPLIGVSLKNERSSYR